MNNRITLGNQLVLQELAVEIYRVVFLNIPILFQANNVFFETFFLDENNRKQNEWNIVFFSFLLGRKNELIPWLKLDCFVLVKILLFDFFIHYVIFVQLMINSNDIDSFMVHSLAHQHSNDLPPMLPKSPESVNPTLSFYSFSFPFWPCPIFGRDIEKKQSHINRCIEYAWNTGIAFLFKLNDS